MFLLFSTYTQYDEDRDDVKLIGVYQSRAIAVSAIARLREQPGFRDSPEIIDSMSCIHPDGFYLLPSQCKIRQK